MLPYSLDMMFGDISLECVVSQRPLCGTLVRLPRPISLMLSYSRRVMIVLSRTPYAVSNGHVYGHSVPLPTAVFIGLTQDSNISLETGFGQIVFLSAVFVGFHSRYQSTLIPDPPP